MRIGKVSESVLKRSVLKEIKTTREEVIIGAGIGEDCAVLALKEDEVFVVSTDPVTGAMQDIGRLAVHVTANDLAASGAEPVGILISALLPESITEEEIKEIMAQVNAECGKLRLALIGGHTEVTLAVNRPVLTVTGIGKAKKEELCLTRTAKPGQDLVVTKWVGLEGSSIIAKEKEAELAARYPISLIREAQQFDAWLSVVPESGIAAANGASAMHDVTEGGIFGALWEMAASAKVGLEVDLKKIPIRQETVEICNFYEINPYELISSGSMLIATDNGHDLVRELAKADIHATVIGKITDGNDRIVTNDGEVRFLEPPKSDELYKVIS